MSIFKDIEDRILGLDPQNPSDLAEFETAKTLVERIAKGFSEYLTSNGCKTTYSLATEERNLVRAGSMETRHNASAMLTLFIANRPHVMPMTIGRLTKTVREHDMDCVWGIWYAWGGLITAPEDPTDEFLSTLYGIMGLGVRDSLERTYSRGNT